MTAPTPMQPSDIARRARGRARELETLKALTTTDIKLLAELIAQLADAVSRLEEKIK